ncbi:MAG: dihydrolipoamide acetyltransferase family protein [Actinomycetota bacterium]
MATEVKMPQLGETVVEGTITKWLKKEGDTIEEDELLVEISTDKVDSEVPSSAGGTIQKILVQEGDTVSVGTPLAVIGEGDVSSDEPAEAAEKDEPKPAAKEQSQDESAEEMAAQDDDQTRAEAPPAEAPKPPAEERRQPAASGGSSAAAAPQEQKQPAQPSPQGDTSKRGIVSPLVRRLADENDIDLDEVAGTGTGGRIRKQDVLRFVEERKSRPAAAQPAAAASQPSGAPPAADTAPAREPGQREELVPWTNIRRRTAEHMVAASREVARAWNAVEVDWTNIVKVRTAAKEQFKEVEGFNLTFMPFLCKAVSDTLMEMPEVNSTFDEANQANLVKRYVNLGIAVALEGGGLIVPVIKDADGKNLAGLARAVNDLATRARTKKLTPDDLTGGTFTITNPGPFGSKLSVPIIPQGQTAILAFEAIGKKVVVTDDDQIAIRSMGYLPMSWDHRTIDGAEAAKFLASLAERIETTDFTSDLSQYLA